MLEKLSVRTFKSLEDVTVELGWVNVFVGANGSGKSNLLEALGVLSAAANGKVDDEALLSRGVRPGAPALYKSAFPARPGTRIPPHLSFGASNASAAYDVTLHNSLSNPLPAWRFKTESWEEGVNRLVGRSPASVAHTNPERGIAALKAVDITDGDALELLELLQGYAIFSPTTAVMRGVAPEPQPRQPMGLSGGTLPRAVLNLIQQGEQDEHSSRIFDELLGLVDWVERIDVRMIGQLSLFPSFSDSEVVLEFHDRFMRRGSTPVSAYNASEGVLYALFLAVVAGHHRSSGLCAVDNADHGLNPRFARSLIEHLCRWYLEASEPRQLLLTTHNPLVLDGLPLQDDRVRLFTVSRTSTGRTSVRRVVINDALMKKAECGWSLSRLWVMGNLGGVPNV